MFHFYVVDKSSCKRWMLNYFITINCLSQVRTSKRFMGITIGVMLEEIQGLYKQHHQPCFLYLSSEVIKVHLHSWAMICIIFICAYMLQYAINIWMQIFGSDPSCSIYLKNLIEVLFRQTTCLLPNIKVWVKWALNYVSFCRWTCWHI